MEPQGITWRRVALAMLLGGLVFGVYRAYTLERGELAFEGESRALSAWRSAPGGSGVSGRLAAVTLTQGTVATFEVCGADLLSPAFEDRVTLAVFRMDPLELMLKVPLDETRLERTARGAGSACLVLGSAPLPREGTYTVDVAWPGQELTTRELAVHTRARVLGHTPLGPSDRAALIVTALGALLLAWTLRRRAPEPPQTQPTGAAEAVRGVRAAVAVLGAVLLVAGAAQLPMWGSTLGLLKGLGLACLQVALAVGLARWLVREPFPLALSRTHGLWAAAATLVLVGQARLALRLVPATGQAPIEAFIAWPSGTLAFALLGAVLPVAEEVFFRGFVYGVLEPRGRWLAFAVTALLFSALHAQQSWGNWGALVSITGAGLVLTGLRAVTRSLTPCVLAHLLYNLVLSRGAYL